MAAKADVVPGPGVRAFVRTFLAVFVVCGLAGLNLWPFTGWHLFSHVRADRITAWEITTVDALGEEVGVPFADLPAGYRTSSHVASGLAGLLEAARLDVCRAWASADPGRRQVVEVRVYAIEESLRDPGARTRELRHVCQVAGG
ncbi:MAG: hypothetical protein ACRD2W_15605 [Acidimicrobiales bacterium]